MAGAIRIFPLKARHEVDSKSSASPEVILLNEFAVHGAIKNMSAHFAISKCKNDSSFSFSSTRTLLFEMDSKVLSVMNDVEDLVITTLILAPAFLSLLTRSAAL